MKAFRWSAGRAFFAQLAETLPGSALFVASGLYSGALAIAVRYALFPLSGLIIADRAVLRGLNNYLAWLAPPIVGALAFRIFWGYAPSPGPVLVCALTALVGAAAGEVRRQRRGTSRK